jgi:hypothetical protein
MGYDKLEFEVDEVGDKLSHYIQKRDKNQNEYYHFAPVSRFFGGFSRKIKLSAAKKLERLHQCDVNLSFSKSELKALQQGHLQGIVRDWEKETGVSIERFNSLLMFVQSHTWKTMAGWCEEFLKTNFDYVRYTARMMINNDSHRVQNFVQHFSAEIAVLGKHSCHYKEQFKYYFQATQNTYSINSDREYLTNENNCC